MMMIVLCICRFGKQGCWQFNALLTSSVWEIGATASVISHQASKQGEDGCSGSFQPFFTGRLDSPKWMFFWKKSEEGGAVISDQN